MKIKMRVPNFLGLLLPHIPSRILARIPKFSYIKEINIHGLRFQYFSNRQDSLWSHAIYDFKYFEPSTIALFISELLKNKSGSFVDIGSHSGLFGIIAMKLGYSITMCEPNPALRKNQQINIMLNDETKVSHQLFCVALGANRDSRTLWVGGSKHSAVSTLSDDHRDSRLKKTLLVNQYSMDDLGLSPTIIKIDVEGYETQVLQGGMKTIMRNKPVIIMEALSSEALLQQEAILLPMGYQNPMACGTHTHDARNYLWIPSI